MSGNSILNRALSDAQSGRLGAALTTVQALARSRPSDIEVLGVLGLLLTQAGQLEQAIYHLTRATEIAPELPGPRNNLANALLQLNRFKEAETHWTKAVESAPDYARAWLGLVMTRVNLDNAQGAIDAALKGLALRPDWPEMARNYAHALSAADRIEDSIRMLEDALARHPDDIALRSSALMASNYIERSAEEIAAAHRAFGGVIGLAKNPSSPTDAQGREIRIGVLSGDLRTHSVGFFAEAIFRHKPSWCRLIALSSTTWRKSDRMSSLFKSLSDDWCDVASMNDDALDRLIREKKIDILIELGGHTSGGRLTALNNKPAALIVTAIGYPNTTGHPAIDLRIVDSHTDPAGSESLCTEELLRLDPCFLSYAPPPDAPEPAMPPDDSPITFGSFNVISKVSPTTLSLWKGAMDACSGSRLILKSRTFGDPAAHAHFVERLALAGIDPSRVEIIAYTATIAEHLKVYSRMHVALDTTPYNGTTTTCEALWMGVPVVTLAGDRHAARVGISLLNAAGVPEFVAHSHSEFARIASDLAMEKSRLTALRTGLREKMKKSSLTDGAAWAERLYAELAQRWRKLTQSHG